MKKQYAFLCWYYCCELCSCDSHCSFFLTYFVIPFSYVYLPGRMFVFLPFYSINFLLFTSKALCLRVIYVHLWPMACCVHINRSHTTAGNITKSVSRVPSNCIFYGKGKAFRFLDYSVCSFLNNLNVTMLYV